MFNEAQLAIIRRALTALAEREMHLNNVVSDDVLELIAKLTPEPVAEPVVAEVVVEEAPAEEAPVEETPEEPAE